MRNLWKIGYVVQDVLIDGRCTTLPTIDIPHRVNTLLWIPCSMSARRVADTNRLTATTTPESLENVGRIRCRYEWEFRENDMDDTHERHVRRPPAIHPPELWQDLRLQTALKSWKLTLLHKDADAAEERDEQPR